MPLVLHDGFRIFFAHVPKTGGSSVEEYLIRRFGFAALSIRQGKVRPWPQRDVIHSPTHLAAADLRWFLPAELDLCFAVVRDPARRAISEYGFQKGQSLMSRLGFSVWLRAMIHAATRDPRIYENHIRPQVDLVPEGAEIFRLEDGLEAIVPRIDAVVGQAAPGVEMGHLLKRASTRIDLTAQDARLLARFYAEDYGRFGYAPPDPSALRSDPWAGLRDLAGRVLARVILAKHRRDWLA